MREGTCRRRRACTLHTPSTCLDVLLPVLRGAVVPPQLQAVVPAEKAAGAGRRAVARLAGRETQQHLGPQHPPRGSLPCHSPAPAAHPRASCDLLASNSSLACLGRSNRRAARPSSREISACSTPWPAAAAAAAAAQACAFVALQAEARICPRAPPLSTHLTRTGSPLHGRHGPRRRPPHPQRPGHAARRPAATGRSQGSPAAPWLLVWMIVWHSRRLQTTLRPGAAGELAAAAGQRRRLTTARVQPRRSLGMAGRVSLH